MNSFCGRVWALIRTWPLEAKSNQSCYQCIGHEDRISYEQDRRNKAGISKAGNARVRVVDQTKV
jgi:hypothetical protein